MDLALNNLQRLIWDKTQPTNTEKSPGDLRRFVVTQTFMKNHQLKIYKEKNKNNNVHYPYLPTPPLWQDMTQGQFFLSGV